MKVKVKKKTTKKRKNRATTYNFCETTVMLFCYFLLFLIQYCRIIGSPNILSGLFSNGAVIAMSGVPGIAE